MKLLLAFLCGVVLASGTAYAASEQAYWKNGGRTYKCSGGPVSVFCTETNWTKNYKPAIYPGAVSVSYGGRLIFWCARKLEPVDNCEYYGP